MVKGARDEGENVLLLGLGDAAGRPDEQGRIKSDVGLRAMRALEFDAMVIGERELALGDDVVLADMKKSGVPIVHTNLTYKGQRVGDTYRIVKRCGRSVGLLAGTIVQHRVWPAGRASSTTVGTSCRKTIWCARISEAVTGRGITAASLWSSFASTPSHSGI